MSNEWKRRLEQVTGAVRDDALSNPPEQITYMGHIYVRRILSPEHTEIAPTFGLSPYNPVPEQANFTQVPYRQSWYGIEDIAGVSLYMELTPVVPGTLEVYVHPFASDSMAQLVGKDDGKGIILSTTAKPLAGTIYYNDGEVKLSEGSYLWHTSNIELIFRYNRLEVAQAYTKSVRGGSIVSVNNDY